MSSSLKFTTSLLPLRMTVSTSHVAKFALKNTFALGQFPGTTTGSITRNSEKLEITYMPNIGKWLGYSKI